MVKAGMPTTAQAAKRADLKDNGRCNFITGKKKGKMIISFQKRLASQKSYFHEKK